MENFFAGNQPVEPDHARTTPSNRHRPNHTAGRQLLLPGLADDPASSNQIAA